MCLIMCQALATGNHTALQPLLKLLFYLTVAVMLVIEPFRPRNFWCAALTKVYAHVVVQPRAD